MHAHRRSSVEVEPEPESLLQFGIKAGIVNIRSKEMKKPLNAPYLPPNVVYKSVQKMQDRHPNLKFDSRQVMNKNVRHLHTSKKDEITSPSR